MTDKQVFTLDWTVRRTLVARDEHLARTLTAGDVANLLRRVVGPLVAANWLTVATCFARSRTPFGEPIIDWQPGDAEPDFGRAASAIDRCWRHFAPREMRVCVPTLRATAHFGAKRDGCPKPQQCSHDIATSRLFEHFLRYRPSDAACWVGENMLDPLPGEKRPDVLLVEDGDAFKAIELGGFRYGESRVRAFHQHCLLRNLQYELH